MELPFILGIVLPSYARGWLFFSPCRELGFPCPFPSLLLPYPTLRRRNRMGERQRDPKPKRTKRSTTQKKDGLCCPSCLGSGFALLLGLGVGFSSLGYVSVLGFALGVWVAFFFCISGPPFPWFGPGQFKPYEQGSDGRPTLAPREVKEEEGQSNTSDEKEEENSITTFKERWPMTATL